MKRLLVRMSALATVVVLGLGAIVQAQRGAGTPPRKFPDVGNANPLRPDTLPPAAAPAPTVLASGVQRQPAPPSAAPRLDPFSLGTGTPPPGSSPTPAAEATPPSVIPDSIPISVDPPATEGLASPALGDPAGVAPSNAAPAINPPPVAPPLVEDRYTAGASPGVYAGRQPASKGSSEPAPFQLDPNAPSASIPSSGDGSYSQPTTTPTLGEPGGTTGSPAAEGTGTPGAAALEGAQTQQLTLEKFAPDEIQVGKPAIFQIKLRNTGSVAAHDVEIHDELPRGTRLLSTNPRASVGVRGELVWPVGTIKPGEEVTAEIELMPVAEGEIGSVASVRFTTDVSVRTRATKPELVVQTSAPAQVLIGQDMTLTITVSNPGSGTATNVVLEERVPPGFVHPAGTELEYEVGDLMPNESRQLQLNLTAERPGPTANVLVARGDASLEVEDQVPIEVVAPQLDVLVEGPKRRYLDREATYTLSITNPGTAPAQQVALVAHLPPGLRFVKANNAGHYDEASQSVHWQLEELPVQETGQVMLTAMPVEIGQQVLAVRATSDLGLSVERELPVTVEGIAAILFEVVDVDDPVEVGGETTYEIRVLNQGSKEATNVRLAVLLPPEMRPVAAEGPARYALEPNRVLFEGLSRLAPKADTTYRVRVQGLQPGDLRVRVQLTTDEIRTPVTKEESTRVYSDE